MYYWSDAVHLNKPRRQLYRHPHSLKAQKFLLFNVSHLFKKKF